MAANMPQENVLEAVAIATTVTEDGAGNRRMASGHGDGAGNRRLASGHGDETGNTDGGHGDETGNTDGQRSQGRHS